MGVFHIFLNFAHGTKSRNAPHLLKCNGKVASYQNCILSSVEHINYKLLIMNNYFFTLICLPSFIFSPIIHAVLKSLNALEDFSKPIWYQ